MRSTMLYSNKGKSNERLFFRISCRLSLTYNKIHINPHQPNPVCYGLRNYLVWVYLPLKTKKHKQDINKRYDRKGDFYDIRILSCFFQDPKH